MDTWSPKSAAAAAAAASPPPLELPTPTTLVEDVGTPTLDPPTSLIAEPLPEGFRLATVNEKRKRIFLVF